MGLIENVKETLDEVSRKQTEVLKAIAKLQIPNRDEWIDSKEVCSQLRISTRTLQHKRDKGLIPFSKVGNRIYYRQSDIQAHLEKYYHKSFQKGGIS